MAIMDDLRIVMSLVTGGGPRGVAEQRIAQVKLEAIAKALKGQTATSEVEKTLRTELQDTRNQLASTQEQLDTSEEHHQTLSEVVQDLKKELRLERAKTTRLTKKLEKQDDDS